MNAGRTVERLIGLGAIAVVRMSDAGRVLRVARALVEGGLPALEITLTTPGAIGLIGALRKEAGGRVLVGVGSVTDAAAAGEAMDAGAAYVVSPILRPDVVDACKRRDVAVMIGGMTPTELQAAHEAGSDIVKVFPAESLGPSYIRAVLAPLPHLRLMPTGGVTPGNAGEWLRAGAVVLGVGGALLDRTAIAEDRFDVIAGNARALRASIAAARDGGKG